MKQGDTMNVRVSREYDVVVPSGENITDVMINLIGVMDSDVYEGIEWELVSEHDEGSRPAVRVTGSEAELEEFERVYNARHA